MYINFFKKIECYLALSEDTQSVATRYWLICLKSHLKVSSTYELGAALLREKRKGTKSEECPPITTRSLYHKEQGQPIKKKETLSKINNLVGEDFDSAGILCHPFWQLIDNMYPTEESINNVLANLPMRYVQALFKEGEYGGLFRKQHVHTRTLDKYERDVNIHSLTFWLAMYIESRFLGGTIDCHRAEYHYLNQLRLLMKDAHLRVMLFALEAHITFLIWDINKARVFSST